MELRGPSSKSLIERVEVARDIQRKRYKNLVGVSCNAQMPPELIREYCELDEASKNLLRVAYEKFKEDSLKNLNIQLQLLVQEDVLNMGRM